MKRCYVVSVNGFVHAVYTNATKTFDFLHPFFNEINITGTNRPIKNYMVFYKWLRKENNLVLNCFNAGKKVTVLIQTVELL